ncbi:hypothetical protein D3C81_1371410 [compost metagenome]
MSVVSELTREPPGPFGDTPALFTSACNLESPSMGRRVSTICPIWLRSDKSMHTCVLCSWLRGQPPGIGLRETVMTRQPRLRKRSATAWPMPRLAPVTMAVFCSVV